jgi:hypothetical protein
LLAALLHSPARAAALDLVSTTVAAMTCPPARIAALAKGVTASMILSKCKLLLGLLLLAAGFLGVLLGGVLAGARPSAAPATAREAQTKNGPQPAKAPAGEGKENTEDVLSGRVLDEAGKPVAGAKLSLWSGKGKGTAIGETGADGRFRIKPVEEDRTGIRLLIVQTRGFGPDWIDLRNRAGGEITFRLAADVAIRGHVVDLEGLPVAAAQVRVGRISKSAKGDVTAYIDAWKKGMLGPVLPAQLVSLFPESLAIPTPVTADKKGRFRLEGIGRDRVVELVVLGKGMVRKSIWVVTRPEFKSGPVRPSGVDELALFFGPSFNLPLAPGKEVVGVVKEKGSGRPVVGAAVTCQFGRARTDEGGAFRIEGLSRKPVYRVSVGGPGHFQTMSEIKDTPGRDTVRVEIELEKGIHVEGRLLDKATGKPVSGRVEYAIKPDNPQVKAFTFTPVEGLGSAKAGADGKFRILTIPGPGYLAVRADHNRYTRAVPTGWGGSVAASVPRTLLPHYYHATVAIDPDEKKPASLKGDILLDRGLSKQGSIVGPDGKPVRDVIAFGLTAIPDPGLRSFLPSTRFAPRSLRQKESTFTAIGLDPKQPRHLVFVHPEKRLGKLLLLRGDEKGPLVVKLEPLGTVIGRARTKEGTAVAGCPVIPEPPRLLPFYKDHPIELLHNTWRDGWSSRRTLAWLPQMVKTDKEGAFRIDGLVSGLKYTLLVVGEKPGPGVGPTHMHGNVTVESGKTRDLGDLPLVKRP